MIVSKTPYRISFFGGGTDLPEWSLKHGGSVISTTINKYCYISCRQLLPLFDYKHRLVYSKTEQVNSIENIQHPGIRGVLQYANPPLGLEIHHDGDLPARSGLGSSSSFTVGLLRAIYRLQHIQKDAHKIAAEAIHIEQNINMEIVGAQDQVAASYGGFNKIDFNKDGTFSVKPLDISTGVKNLISKHLLLVYSGIQRRAPEIEKSKVENLDDKSTYYQSISDLVKQAEFQLLSEEFNIEKFGGLLHEGWLMKRSLSEKVSSDKIDEIYSKALSAGAYGGKVLGAGGGGFLMFLAPPERHDQIKSALKDFIFVDCDFEDEGAVTFDISNNGI